MFYSLRSLAILLHKYLTNLLLISTTCSRTKALAQLPKQPLARQAHLGLVLLDVRSRVYFLVQRIFYACCIRPTVENCSIAITIGFQRYCCSLRSFLLTLALNCSYKQRCCNFSNSLILTQAYSYKQNNSTTGSLRLLCCYLLLLILLQPIKARLLARTQF